MLAGLLLLSVSVMATAFAPSFELLLVLRVATGLGGGMLPPNAIAALSEVISPQKRAQAVGGLMAINVMSSAISVPVIALLADRGGWRFAVLIPGLMLVAGLLANWLWFPADSRERVRNFAFFSRLWSLLSLRFVRVAVLVNITHRIAFWAIVSYFAAYLIGKYEVSVGYVALPLAILAMGQVAGSYATGVLARNRYRYALIAGASLLGGTCGLLFYSVDLPLWVAVAVATIGAGLLSVTFPTLVAISTLYSGESRATGVGLMGLSNQGGGVFGAAVAGILLASTGFEGIGYLCLGVTAACALSTLLFARMAPAGNERP